MEVRLVDDARQWNRFVSNTAGSIQQSYEWSQLMNQAGELTLCVGVFTPADDLIGAALIRVERLARLSWPYLYVPRGPVCERPLEPVLTVLKRYLDQTAKHQRAFMIRVEPAVPAEQAEWSEALKRTGFHVCAHSTQIRHEWLLDLTPSEEHLLAQMKGKCRYNIRLAQRGGITIRSGTPADIGVFYRLYQETSRRARFLIHPQAYYTAFMELFGTDGRAALLLAEYADEPIAACIVAQFGEQAWYMFGASTRTHRDRMPNYLLQWHAMRWAKGQGCQRYNLRGLADEFKRGFGATQVTTLATHDFVYRPAQYATYRALVAMRQRIMGLRNVTGALRAALRKVSASSIGVATSRAGPTPE